MRQKSKELELPPLQVYVMSATLEIETFQAFFPQAKYIKIPGRQFPVQTLFTPDFQEDYIDSALSTVLQNHDYEDEGDVLIFLPGSEDIENLAGLLRKYLDEESELAKSLKHGGKGQNGEDNNRSEKSKKTILCSLLKGVVMVR